MFPEFVADSGTSRLEGAEQKAARWVSACEKTISIEQKIRGIQDEVYRRSTAVSMQMESFFKSLQDRAQPIKPQQTPGKNKSGS